MRHTSKRTLVAAVLLLLFFAPWSVVFGQSNGHFEWAKGFGTSFSNNGACHITGSVTDSLGNLYILGQFRNDSEWGTGWDAERLLPMAPYGPWQNNINTIIAKISPNGEMVWKKVIHSNNGSSQTPIDIKKVGDTAFVCLVEMVLPTEDHYVYYLDTLIPGRSDYPVNSMYVRTPMRTAFIMFDFEGNVIEQHFLYQTYTDTAGNDFVKYYDNDTTPWVSGDRFRNPSFDIDADGNIYICRASMDRLDDSINAANGTIHGIKFWVDNRMVGEYINENSPMFWYPQIMKFSPHFDTMLACRYIVQNNNNIEYSLFGTHTKLDKYGNVYFMTQMYQNGDYIGDSIIIDSTRNIFLCHTDKAIQKDFLVQLNSSLTPNWLITLNDSVISNSPHSALVFFDINFDYEKNLLFLSGETVRATYSDTTNFYSVLTYRGIPLNLKNEGFFIAFNLSGTIPTLHSYGKIPGVFFSSCSNSANGDPTKNTLIASGNRVILQGKYLGGIRMPEQTILFNDRYDYGLGLTVFDYAGNVIEVVDYDAMSIYNLCGPISLHDSILYISGELVTDATFGSIQFGLNGFSQTTYIAKYADPALMLPYTGDTGNVNITLTPDLGVFTAYPNPFRQRVNIKIENTELKTVNGTVSATLTDITGRSEEVQLAVEGDGRYVLDLTARPQASYLLTLTTEDGRQHTVRLLKQSDITPGR